MCFCVSLIIYLFISGQGMAMASFMGKGVISQAALSLAHLVQSSHNFTLPQVWFKGWIKKKVEGKKKRP